MAVTIYQECIPPCIRALSNLVHILEQGAAHAEARAFDPAVLVDSRLFPDIFPLSRQVQVATDIAKAGASRLAQLDPPSYEDRESTFPELIERVRRTIAYLQSMKPSQYEGAELGKADYLGQY